MTIARPILTAAALCLAMTGAAAPLLAQQQAVAATQGGLVQKGGKQPIDITSDTLTVEQKKQLATFTGNVDAVQGDMKLRADRLLVHYAPRPAGGAAAPAQVGTAAGPKAEPASSAPAPAGPASSSIQKIEAFGQVVLTSPAETAQGSQGVYDVVAGTMQLTGDVILTRGDNVIRGDRLDMDLNSGLSKVSGGQKAGRVRALFTPGDAAAGSAKPGTAKP